MKCAEDKCEKTIGGENGRMTISLRASDGDDDTFSATEAGAVYCQEHGKAIMFGFLKATGAQAQARKESRE